MLSASTVDILFLILAILATRTLQTAGPLGYKPEPPTPRTNGFYDTVPETPLSASFSPNPSQSVRRNSVNKPTATATTVFSVPQITLTPDEGGGDGNKQSELPIFKPRPILKGSRHGRKSVSFSLSSMDEITKSPNYKPMIRRPPTPFIRGPASPSERGQVGELVLGMSVGIGLGAGLGEDPSDDDGSIEGVGSGSGSSSDLDDCDSGEITPKPKTKARIVLAPQVDGLDHSKEKIDNMGVKKEWLMPK